MVSDMIADNYYPRIQEVQIHVISTFFIQEIRNIVKDIEQIAREILTTLQNIHHEGGIQESKYV
jgi:hypothetical protein